MNDLQVFRNEEFGQIRTVEINGEPWFISKDVTEALGFGNPRQAVASHVDEEDKAVHILDTLGGKQEATIINESGLYSLILGSRIPGAKMPQTYSEALRALADKAEEADRLMLVNQKLEEQNIRMRPKEIFADAVAASKTSILVGELAKLITQNGYEIGQQRLFRWLREKGYLMSTGTSYNMPMQRYVQQGLFEIKESNVQNPDGSVRITKTTKVTGKGQQYFINKFIG